MLDGSLRTQHDLLASQKLPPALDSNAVALCLCFALDAKTHEAELLGADSDHVPVLVSCTPRRSAQPERREKRITYAVNELVQNPAVRKAYKARIAEQEASALEAMQHTTAQPGDQAAANSACSLVAGIIDCATAETVTRVTKVHGISKPGYTKAEGAAAAARRAAHRRFIETPCQQTPDALVQATQAVRSTHQTAHLQHQARKEFDCVNRFKTAPGSKGGKRRGCDCSRTLT